MKNTKINLAKIVEEFNKKEDEKKTAMAAEFVEANIIPELVELAVNGCRSYTFTLPYDIEYKFVFKTLKDRVECNVSRAQAGKVLVEW